MADITTGSSRARRLLAALDALAREHPSRLLACFVGTSVVLWTLVPALVYTGLPLDVAEGYAIGREWVIGSHKHPALPYWLLEASVRLTGAFGWPAFLMSSLLIAATYAIVYRIGCETVGRLRALAGTLPLAGVAYFGWVAPELNHNVVQMPVWVGIVWLLWRARERGGSGAWIALGALSALGVYAKLSTVLLLAVAAGYILADGKCRRQLARPAPWIGLGVFVIGVLPLARWLAFGSADMLDYAEQRMAVQPFSSALTFLPKQLLAAGGLVLCFCWSAVAGWRADGGDLTQGEPVRADARRFLLTFLLGPLLLAVVSAATFWVGLRGAWGTAMTSLAGLAVLAIWPHWLNRRAFEAVVSGSVITVIAVPIAHALTIGLWPIWSDDAPKVAWPQRTIARRLEAVWTEKTGQPLRYVVGDTWSGAMVATFAAGRPSLVIDGRLALSPWIDARDFERRGALVVWARRRDNPPLDFRQLAGDRVDGTIVFPIAQGRSKADVAFHYTFILPRAVGAQAVRGNGTTGK